MPGRCVEPGTSQSTRLHGCCAPSDRFPASWYPPDSNVASTFAPQRGARPYGPQLASVVPYTVFVVLGTFSAQKGQQSYFFECSTVHRQLPRLAQRHIGFLVALLVIETVAFQLRPHLLASWIVASGRNGSAFAMSLFILCIGLASAQVWINRSLLERAHLENVLD